MIPTSLSLPSPTLEVLMSKNMIREFALCLSELIHIQLNQSIKTIILRSTAVRIRTCRIKEDILLCLKKIGRIFAAKSPEFSMIMLNPS